MIDFDSNEVRTEFAPITKSYPALVSDVLKYIADKKREGSTDSIIDIIMTFCINNNYDPEEVGDAIHDDFYFSELIKNDMMYSELQNSEKDNLEDW